jgi:Ankyrin repeats (many copies)
LAASFPNIYLMGNKGNQLDVASAEKERHILKDKLLEGNDEALVNAMPALTVSNKATKQRLPWEIIDEILVLVGNVKLAVVLERFSIVKKIDKKADFNWAIKNGRIKYLKFLNEKGLSTGGYGSFAFSLFCIEQNGFEVVKYCHENIGSILDCSYIVLYVAEKDDIDLVKYLSFVGFTFTTHSMDRAACHGYFEILKWLHANRQEGCTTDAMDHAAAHGHLEVVQWLHDNRDEGCTTSAMDYAAAYGHLEVVQWLHDNRQEGCTTDAMDHAAAHGHLEVLQWLHDNRNEGRTTRAMDRAATYGHLEIVKWLHDNRSE